ncbi:MAG TPA: helix-turn-helix transcriptional regulator [Streptosporangiaceae bacterium]|jgi:DNA-binding transcriptional regulator YiaG
MSEQTAPETVPEAAAEAQAAPQAQAQAQDEAGAESLLRMRRGLGRQLAAMRNRAGLSQWDLAPLTGYSRGTLSDAEVGRHRLRREFWLRCDGLLQGEGRLVASYDRIESTGEALRQRSSHSAQQARDRLVSARLRAVRPFPEPAPSPPEPAPGPPEPAPAPPAAAPPEAAPPGVAQLEPRHGSRVTMEACPHCQRPIAVLIVPSTQA